MYSDDYITIGNAGMELDDVDDSVTGNHGNGNINHVHDSLIYVSL